jgi:hypothetical protein
VHNALIGAAASAATAATGLAAFATHPPGPVTVQPPRYVVASTADLSPRTDVLGSAATYYQAQVALAAFLQAHPEQRDAVQVLAAHEAVTP